MLTANYDKYRLRWRFDFNGRASRWGQWSRPATRLEDMAAFRNAEGLIRAAIEAQSVETDDIHTVVECDGHDFCNFQWISAAFGLAAPYARIVGIALITRDEQCRVFVDGSTKIENRTEADKKYHYETYGR